MSLVAAFLVARDPFLGKTTHACVGIPKALWARAFEPHASVYDTWWENRQAANLVGRDGKRGPPANPPPGLPLDEDFFWRSDFTVRGEPVGPSGSSIRQALQEFVESAYARTLCNRFNVSPTDYGQIDGMFQTVTLSDARLKLRLKQAFNERNEALMDRLSRYLRVRVPDLREIQAVHGAPGREGLDIY